MKSNYGTVMVYVICPVVALVEGMTVTPAPPETTIGALARLVSAPPSSVARVVNVAFLGWNQVVSLVKTI